MFGIGKRAAERKRTRLEWRAEAYQHTANEHLKAYQRTKDPERLAAYRLHAADAKAYRRGIDPYEEGMPDDLKREWHVEESQAIARKAFARHEARNGGAAW